MSATNGEHAGVVEVKGRPRIQYQSEVAEIAANVPKKQEDDTPKSALISVPPEVVTVSDTNWNENVPVVVRMTIPRTQIGPNWYSFQAGKKYLVPRHIKRHLEEKGVA